MSDFIHSFIPRSVFHRLHRRLVGSLLVGLAVLALAPAVAADRARFAQASVSADLIVWKALGNETTWVLRVAGPGFTMKKVFERGEDPYLTRIAEDGQPLMDGSYRWEVRSVPERGNERESEENESTVARASRNTQVEWQKISRQSVASGSFRVRGGIFVRTEPQPEEDER